MLPTTLRRTLGWIHAVFLALAPFASVAAAGPLRVVATTPDLGDLTREVGGDEVSVTVLAKGPQDPHFVEPRPSFVRVLHRADLFVQTGMELEKGWAPVLLERARNPDVIPGGGGFLDASSAIAPLEVPTTRVDRSMGDVHPYGNPHYLTDPLNGMRVARLLRDKLAELRPGSADAFAARYDAFALRIVVALLGESFASGRDPQALAAVLERGGPPADASIGGWLGALRPHAGARAVQDHRLWPYFARRFGIELIDTLEPRPGIAPTTRHLAEVVARMQAQGARLVLSSAYFDPRHARWIAERTAARVVEMAHQVGAREGADDYLASIGSNVRGVLDALEAAGATSEPDAREDGR
jgi:ABC-type Zn uptake system ZnuABC Zn-binding protein ZnuA